MKGLAIFFVLFIIGMFAMIVHHNSTKDERIYNELKSQILAETQAEANVQDLDPEPIQVKQKEWVKIKTWTGTGMKNTETFKVENAEWRVVWKTSNELFQGAGLLQAYLNTSSGELKELPINQLGLGTGDTVMRGAGSYYLEISSANLTWEISVYDYRTKE